MAETDPRARSGIEQSTEIGEKPIELFEVHVATNGGTPEQAQAFFRQLTDLGIAQHDYFLTPPYNLDDQGQLNTQSEHDLDQPLTMSSQTVGSYEEAARLVRGAMAALTASGLQGNFEIEGLMMEPAIQAVHDRDIKAEFPGYQDTFDRPHDVNQVDARPRPRFESHLTWNTMAAELLTTTGPDGGWRVDGERMRAIYSRVIDRFTALTGVRPDQIVVFCERPLNNLAPDDTVNVIGTAYHQTKTEMMALQAHLAQQPRETRDDHGALFEQVITVIEKTLGI